QVKQNLRLAEQLGGETVVLTGRDVVQEIVDYAHSRNVTKIIIGKPRQARWLERWRGSLVDAIIMRSGEIDVYVIKGDEDEGERAQAAAPPPPLEWRRYAWAVLAVAVCTAIAWSL